MCSGVLPEMLAPHPTDCGMVKLQCKVFPAAGGSKDGMMDASIGHTALKNSVRRIMLVDTDPTGQRNRSRFHDKLYHYAHLSTDPQRNLWDFLLLRDYPYSLCKQLLDRIPSLSKAF